MKFKSYAKHSVGLELNSTLRALLTEDGSHMFRLAFDKEPELPRNCMFGVMLVRRRANNCEIVTDWGTNDEMKRCSFDCIYLCYELCEAFPLCVNSEQYNCLQKTIERILAVPVRLLPFTNFQRSIGMYSSVLGIFQEDNFTSLFRDDEGSLLDLKMNVVLSRWQSMPFQCPTEPPTSPGATNEVPSNTIPIDEWNKCFASIARVTWYHAYVYEIIGEDARDGYSESNVLRTYDALCASGCSDVQGKLALLDILKLVYRYNYSVH
jgi:hypothetical protein